MVDMRRKALETADGSLASKHVREAPTGKTQWLVEAHRGQFDTWRAKAQNRL
jgi:hypothetical protein